MRRAGQGTGEPPPAMGSCVTREFLASAHKEPAAVAPPESCAPAAAPPEQGSEEASGGILPDTCASPGGARHVTALASSSLGGLVQTIKDHVTKPTAMAHGRVAHLIEWKGWSAPQMGWEPSLTDEECYADLADELKEARFAAGVAEQFVITEAMLSAWSSLDEEGLTVPGTLQDVTQLQDLGGLYLQETGSPVLFTPQAVSSLHLAGSSTPALSPPPSRESPSLPSGHPTVANGWSTLGGSLEKPLPWRAVGQQESAASSLWQPPSRASLRCLDSSSLSEDEVFYN